MARDSVRLEVVLPGMCTGAGTTPPGDLARNCCWKSGRGVGSNAWSVRDDLSALLTAMVALRV